MKFLPLWFCLVGAASYAQAEEPALKFVEVPVLVNRINEKSIYADVINRCENARDFATGPVLDTDSRDTNAHESTHRLQAQLRNARGGRVNAFYLLNGKACIVKEPGMRLSYACRFIPASIRSYRYGTYCEMALRHWDDRPLYWVDEWSAYINGCSVSLEDTQQRRHVIRSDAASGILELGLYSVAMAMAVEKYDPEYFKNDPQFLPFMRYQWKRACEIYTKAAPLFPSDNQVRQLKALQGSPDAAAMRQFIAAHLDGVWLK
jgi:hypothetical protein